MASLDRLCRADHIGDPDDPVVRQRRIELWIEDLAEKREDRDRCEKAVYARAVGHGTENTRLSSPAQSRSFARTILWQLFLPQRW